LLGVLKASLEVPRTFGEFLSPGASRQPNLRHDIDAWLCRWSAPMELRDPSRTAINTAMQRAAHLLLDDEPKLRSLLHAYRILCGDVIARYDGFVARYVGDGIGWPTAHEEDAERAVRAALEIVHTVKRASFTEDLSVRIGIATGPVVGETAGVGDQSKLAVGSTPNLAARLQALAIAGQIVIAASTRRLAGNAFDLTDLGEHDLKGIAEPVHAWRVERPLVAESRFDANRGGNTLTPLVGRNEELELLLRHWCDAAPQPGKIDEK
jgi:class 3 adenylate cyclase